MAEQDELVGGERNTFSLFLRSTYGPVVLFLIGMLSISLLASHFEAEQVAAASVPDVVKTYQNCEYLGESIVMVRYITFDYISTSCGSFHKPLKKFELEKGQTYDIEKTSSATKGTYISDIAPSAK